MKRRLLCLIFFSSAFFGVLFFLAVRAQETATGTPDNIRTSIEEKTKQLEKINEEIKKTEEQITQSKTQSRTLEKDVSRLSSNISQLNLQIRASEITVEKLALELSRLSIDISDIETQVKEKREGIAASLRMLQQRDSEFILISLLRGESLADTVVAAQHLSDLNSQLGEEVRGLAFLSDSLQNKLTETSLKKGDLESEKVKAEAKKVIASDQKVEQEQLLKLTKTQQKNYETQLSKLEKQQTDLAAEIDTLEDELRLKFNVSLFPDKRPGVFIMPVAGRITQHYGEVSNLYRGKPHNGLDIGAPLGTEIRAARDGIVREVGNNGRLQYGRYVLIEHDNGLSTLYAHMSRQAAVKGATVKRGQIIGYVGNTGYSFGNHLHMGLYWTASLSLKSFPGAGLVPVGVTLNPLDYI